ncbi:hypothetical protein DU502_16245 [Haloplanus aerogenes]|uniref:Small CPxCG-related zinc finger protein n=1 Tax=Haloplanus aerogenes TaxID=660522 RepID=A0A3G8R0K1_9EURY|nr:hypothetical protein [Haloplanus aerogenes]AZH27259.1 hypothetical protein DU502_16245 [Haloplanus aerogenes]
MVDLIPLDPESNPSECQFCGTHVSDDFRRTLGDEDNVAHRCLACDSRPRIQSGSAAGREVKYPDPADQPNRNRGRNVSETLSDGGVDQ